MARRFGPERAARAGHASATASYPAKHIASGIEASGSEDDTLTRFDSRSTATSGTASGALSAVSISAPQRLQVISGTRNTVIVLPSGLPQTRK